MLTPRPILRLEALVEQMDVALQMLQRDPPAEKMEHADTYVAASVMQAHIKSAWKPAIEKIKRSYIK